MNIPPEYSETLSTRPSNRLIEETLKPSTNLVDSELVRVILDRNRDLVEERWQPRHAKLIYLKGVSFYEELAHRSRKYGKQPKALMGSLVDKALKKTKETDNE